MNKAGIKSLVGHHRRHHLQVRTLQTLLRERRIGDLVGVSAIWATYKPDAFFEAGPWRKQPGGGPILINLIHEIDFLRFVAGEISAIGALTSNRRRHHAVEDSAAAFIEFESGALGSSFASDAAVSPWTTEQGIGKSVEFPSQRRKQLPLHGKPGRSNSPISCNGRPAARKAGTNLCRRNAFMRRASILILRSSIISAT